jgi:hypothetical protein
VIVLYATELLLIKRKFHSTAFYAVDYGDKGQKHVLRRILLYTLQQIWFLAGFNDQLV